MAYFPGNDLNLGTVLSAAKDPLWMSASDRARHLYVVGATRTGKSKLLEDFIRQDILAWWRTQCGLVLIDPHGKLYENVVEWVAAEDPRRELPVVPFELRRSDWVVSYNLLRRQSGDPAALLNGFVRGILHAWGQANVQETPRLFKWLRTLLATLYDNNLTLAQAKHIIASPRIRHALAANVKDEFAKLAWASAPPRESDFQEQVESSINRLGKLISTHVLEVCLSQADVSFDLGNALEQGSIVLVSLSRKGGDFDDEDAATFGSLFLSDLWNAAHRRGKAEEGELKPCYVYLDEFQEFLTPTMAKTLDQASGFGLHLTLAHQFPSQLLKGEDGQLILKSVLANARSKIVFQLEEPDDLETLSTLLFRHHVDLDEVKFQPYSTKVMGHKFQYVQGHSIGTTTAEGEGQSSGRSVSSAHGRSIAEGVSRGKSTQKGVSRGRTDGAGTAISDARGETEASSTTRGKNWGSTIGRDAGTGSAASQSHSASWDFGPLSEQFQDEFQDYMDGRYNEDEQAEFLRKWVKSFAVADATSNSQSKFASDSSSTSIGGSDSVGESLSQSKQQGRTDNRTVTTARSDTDLHADTHMESQVTTDQFTEGQSYSETEETTRSKARNETTNFIPMLFPVMGQEALPPIYRTIEEQLFRATQFLSSQPDRHCVIKLVTSPRSLPVMTRTVSKAYTTPEWVEEWRTQVLQRLVFAIPMQTALDRMNGREATLLHDIFKRPIASTQEPTDVRRRLRPPST